MADNYYKRNINVRSHKRFDPRVGKKVNVSSYERNQNFRAYKNITKSESKLLDEIRLYKKDQDIMRKIKKGPFTKNITKSERKLLDKPMKIQMNIFNEPTKDAYQREYNKTMKEIIKISGLGEIEERLGVLQTSYINIQEDFEAELRPLNDERKELELKIKKIKKKIDKGPKDKKNLKRKLKILEQKHKDIVNQILKSDLREDYLKKRKIIEDRIQKYQRDIEKFYFDFVDDLNKRLEKLGTEKGFSELYLYDDLRLGIKKDKKHKIKINGKEYIANVKVYKFEDLNKEMKEKILKIIKEEFKNDYIIGEPLKVVKSPSKSLETLETKERYIKTVIKSNSKKQLYSIACAKKIKGRSKMTKEQLARAIDQTEMPLSKKDSEHYTDKLELLKLWNKHYDKETGEGTEKYIEASKKYFEKKGIKIVKEPTRSETNDFLKSFKDKGKGKKSKKSKQTNLDKMLNINTKLFEEYGDMKAFSKKQKRLG